MLKNGLQYFVQVRRFAFTPAVFFAASLWVSSASIAQDVASSSSVPPAEPVSTSSTQVVSSPPVQKHVGPERDFSLGIFGDLTSTRRTNYSQIVSGPNSSYNQYEYVVGASTTPGALLSYHQQNSTWSGYKVNLGYTETTVKNSLVDQYLYLGPIVQAGTYFQSNALHTSMVELSGAYTVEFRAKEQRLRMFGEVGGGVLAFVSGQGRVEKEFDAMALAGMGVDWRLTDHVGLRAEYRGLLTGIPAYQVANYIHPITLISEPTFSVVYRLGRAKIGK